MKAGLKPEDFAAAAARIGCLPAAVAAVCEVEAPKGGFTADGSPTTLFEAHKFHAFTGGRFDGTHPHLSSPTWNRELYGKDAKAEKKRLEEAIALDRVAALKSASWGRFQIMGFNYQAAGFAGPEEEALEAFVAAMSDSEAAQLEAFVSLILSWGLGRALRTQDFAAFARRYNGPEYRANRYDDKMAAAFEAWQKKLGGKVAA